MTDTFPSYYPVFLNLRTRHCIVIGGGHVAFRKVSALIDCGASVKVISPELCSEIDGLSMQGKVSVMKRRYRPGDLNDAFVAIAATGDRMVNLEIAKEARENNILINVVDDPDISDFIVPSCLRRGDITVAVSTSGRSPALARKVRLKLERELADEYAALAVLISDVRKEINGLGLKISSENWQNAIDLDVLIDLLKKNETDRARSLLLEKLKSPHQLSP